MARFLFQLSRLWCNATCLGLSIASVAMVALIAHQTFQTHVLEVRLGMCVSYALLAFVTSVLVWWSMVGFVGSALRTSSRKGSLGQLHEWFVSSHQLLLIPFAHGNVLLVYQLPLAACIGLIDSLVSPRDTAAYVLIHTLVPLCVSVLMWAYMLYSPQQEEKIVVRGRTLTSREDAQDLQRRQEHGGVPWGGVTLPITNALTHFLLLGTTRSGKTVNMRLLMQAVLPHLNGNGDLAGRALLYDPKTEFVPLLTAMGVPESDIRIMHPFDSRCWAWDLAADIETPTDATNLAAVFIPEPKGKEDSFFVDAPRDILASVLIAIHLTRGKNWTLRDLLLVFRDRQRVAELIALTPATRKVLDLYSIDERTLGNIIATLRKDLARYEPIAACWEQAGNRRLSLNEWASSRTILVLGNDDSAREQIHVVNRCIVQRGTEMLLARKQSVPRDRSWLVFDEAREMGRLSGLHHVMVRGAGCGIHVVLGCQSVQGMMDVYGENVAMEILGQCNNLAVFRLGNNRKTAEWAADVIGKAERLEHYTSHTTGRETSTTTNEQLHERYLFLPEELQNMDATDPEHGLRGVFISPEYGVIDAAQAEVSGEKLFNELLIPATPSVPAYIPRPISDHFLEDEPESEPRGRRPRQARPSRLDTVKRFT